MSIWNKIFSKEKKNKLENNNNSTKSFSFETNKSNRKATSLYDNYQVRKSVNFIGGLIASTRLEQTYKDSKTELIKTESNKTMFLLNHAFNKNLTAFKGFKQMITRMLIFQDSFTWIRKDENGKVIELIPLLSSQYRLLVPENYPDDYYVEFTFKDGSKKILPYEDLLHFTYDFMDERVFGDSNIPLVIVTEINDDLWESLITWNKDNTIIKGFLKTATIMKQSDMEKTQNEFSKMLKAEQNSYMVMDGKFDYIPVNEKNTPMDVAYITKIENTMNKYFGISERIMDGTASKDELETFHKIYMKPLYSMIEQELEAKFLNNKAMTGYDRKIRFMCSQFDHMSSSEKTTALTMLSNLGAVTINEIRNQYGLARIEDGDKMVYSKNFAEVGKTDETSNKDKSKEDKKEPIKEEEEIDAEQE